MSTREILGVIQAGRGRPHAKQPPQARLGPVVSHTAGHACLHHHAAHPTCEPGAI